MTNSKMGLDDIRREIDRIDQAMHGLLMERGKLISDLQAAKGVTGERGSSAMRPARESRMMRTLAARHSGPFPLVAVERIWREIISAFTQLQAGFSVYAAGTTADTLAEMGRFYFGVTTPLTLEGSIQDVVTKAESDINAVGLIAAPISAWWMDLATIKNRKARIVAHVPFHNHQDYAPIWRHQGWVVSQAPFDVSDCDRSVAVLQSAVEVDQAEVEKIVRSAGFQPKNWRIIDQTRESGTYFTLIDVEGHHTSAEIDPSLELHFLGGYGVLDMDQQGPGERHE